MKQERETNTVAFCSFFIYLSLKKTKPFLETETHTPTQHPRCFFF